MLEGAAISADANRGIVVGSDFSDDAAILATGGSEHLVLTADVIAPIVDDAYTFGQIAATNSISDVFAMGGRPTFALNLVFFPDDQLPGEILAEMLRGGADAAATVGVPIVGGHTVRDDQVKYGLSVTGTVAPDRVLSNRGASAGQALVLSKALGTGVLGTAIKKQIASSAQATAAVESMTTHNAAALSAAREFGVTAATDVTGFGLLGHLRNILRGSELAATIKMDALPLLPGALELTRDGHVPGGSRANLRFVEASLKRVGDEDEALTLLAADAQTSGGLLLCVPAEAASDLADTLRELGLPGAVVGELVAPTSDAPTGTTTLRFGGAS